MGIKKSFTLIETIVVLSIILLIIPIIYIIIFNLVQQQIKVYRLTTIKNEGDYIINTLNYLIRNEATAIYSSIPADDTTRVCLTSDYSPTPENGLYFLNKSNNLFRIFLDNNKIASQSTSTIYLNSDKTMIDNFNIICQSGNDIYSSPIVIINFNICFKNSNSQCSSNKAEEINNLYYQTAIKLRSF